MYETQYPHMAHVDGALAACNIMILGVSADGVKFSTGDTIEWPTLIAAAEQRDEATAAPYMDAWKQAAAMLRELPRREQGLRVEIFGPTDMHVGSTLVMDASGQIRSDLRRSDEGCQTALHLAEKEARDIRKRLGIA